MLNTTPIVFLDTETTGLHPDHHHVWEVAAIRVEGDNREEWVWQLEMPDHEHDPTADSINRFHDRRFGPRALTSTSSFCAQFSGFTNGCHLAGAVVSFDEERLRRMMERELVAHGWHYHLIDVENLAVGYLAHAYAHHRPNGTDPNHERLAVTLPPWNSDAVAAAVGVRMSSEDRHTALGDARWAERIYNAVMIPCD